MALRHPLEAASAMLSEPGLVTYKTLTPQDREMMLAYADKCPRATLQAIADRFWVSKSTVKRTLGSMREKRRSIATQLGHKEDAPDNVANAYHCPADMRGEGSSPDDSSSALFAVHSDEQGLYDAVAGVSSQSLTCETWNSDVSFFASNSCATTSSFFNQQNFGHHASIDRSDSQAYQNTTIPTFESWTSDNTAAAPFHLEGSLVVPSQTFVPPADQSMTMENAKPPRSSQDRSDSLPTTKQHKIRPDEAHKALEDVIEYCMRQPPGFLDLEEGVLLGKLIQRLRSLAVDQQY